MLRTAVVLNLLSLRSLLPKLILGDLGYKNLGCAALEAIFPNKTFQPGDSVYDYEAKNFWSKTEILNPACVFRPTSSEDVATALLVNQITWTQFAVRGGGHMGIKVSFDYFLARKAVLTFQRGRITSTMAP